MNQNERTGRPRPKAETQTSEPRKKVRKPAQKPVRKKKRKLLRVKNPHFWRNIGIAAAISVALFFTLSIFFKIDKVSVSGNSFYTEGQIVEASGVQPGDNLLAMSKSAVAGRITKALPYVSSVQVRRILPDEIIIHVEEESVTFAVSDTSGRYWLVTGSGKVIEPAQSAAGHILVEGFTIPAPTAGEQMVDMEGEATVLTRQVEAACGLMKAVEGSELFPQITSIEVPEDFHVALHLGDQYVVTFAENDDFAYKLRYLQSVLDELDSFSAGEIDLTFADGDRAVFRPAG